MAGLPGDPTMAGLAPRVEYLAGFCCPLGGLAAGKPRVLCHGAEVFLSTGSELVYVYDREGRLLIVSTRQAGEGPGTGGEGGAGVLGPGGGGAGRESTEGPAYLRSLYSTSPGPHAPGLTLPSPRTSRPCTSFPVRCGTWSSWPFAGRSTSCALGAASIACLWTRRAGEAWSLDGTALGGSTLASPGLRRTWPQMGFSLSLTGRYFPALLKHCPCDLYGPLTPGLGSE